MVGESQTVDLTDIDLQEIKKYNIFPEESKNLCFLREKIKEMNYAIGAHTCKPVGNIKHSSKIYVNKYMSTLGLNYFINKHKNRFIR